MIVTIIYDTNQNPIEWELYAENRTERRKLSIMQDLTFKNESCINAHNENSVFTSIKTSDTIMSQSVQSISSLSWWKRLLYKLVS